jgi:ribosomal protein S13
MFLFPKSKYANKPLVEGLASVYGINFQKAVFIARACGVNPYVKVRYIYDSVFQKIVNFVAKEMIVGKPLEKTVKQNLQTLYDIRSYRAIRLCQGLPSHGQRSRANGGTVKKLSRVRHAYYSGAEIIRMNQLLGWHTKVKRGRRSDNKKVSGRRK